jgi:hypothetical protein
MSCCAKYTSEAVTERCFKVVVRMQGRLNSMQVHAASKERSCKDSQATPRADPSRDFRETSSRENVRLQGLLDVGSPPEKRAGRSYAAIDRVLLHKHRVLGLVNQYEISQRAPDAHGSNCTENLSGLISVMP